LTEAHPLYRLLHLRILTSHGLDPLSFGAQPRRHLRCLVAVLANLKILDQPLYIYRPSASRAVFGQSTVANTTPPSSIITLSSKHIHQLGRVNGYRVTNVGSSRGQNIRKFVTFVNLSIIFDSTKFRADRTLLFVEQGLTSTRFHLIQNVWKFDFVPLLFSFLGKE